MVMGEAGNPEAIWTVQVVAPTEIHMMVTVRYDSMSIMTTDNHFVAQRRAAQMTNQNDIIDYHNLQSQVTAVFPSPEETAFQAPFLKLFFFPFI